MQKIVQSSLLALSLIYLTSLSAEPKNIFFELDDILFETGSFESLRSSSKFGELVVRSVSENVAKYRQELFQLLSKLNYTYAKYAPEDLTVFYRGEKLPNLWYAYLLNEIDPQPAYDAAVETINANVRWHQPIDKEIYLTAAEMAFSPEKEVELTRMIQGGWDLVQRCVANPENRVFIFSNKNVHVLGLLKFHHAEFFEQFQDSIIVSGHCKKLKPHADTYTYILEEYGIDASSCYFIESQEQYQNTAPEGSRTFVVKDKNFAPIIEQLVAENVIQPLE